MPFYEYVCDDCHQVHVDLRRMEDRDAPGTCPDCGSTRVKRALSRFTAVVSGTPCGAPASSCPSSGSG